MQTAFDVLLRIPEEDSFDEVLPEGAEFFAFVDGFSYYWIDTVFYSAPVTEHEVKRSLIDHDGYDSRIVVRKQRTKKLEARG